MLKKIFISKVRVKILDTYLSDLNAAYHVRGLVRLLEEEINAVRRELINLEIAGILKSKKDGNKLVYRVVKTCPILFDLRSMFFKDSEMGQSILEVINKTEGVDIAVLTDSFIQKKYDHDTDVDILFIGSMKIRDLTSSISALEKEIGRDIRFSAIRREDFDFARKKNEPFLVNILDHDKIILFGQISDLL